PLGVAGELCIGGPGVARGYLNRPDLTADKFIDDPFSTQAGAKLYRTGDIARFRADGVVELVGRADHQVKIRGFRIELGEIETALQRFSGVRQAVVGVFEPTAGDRRLAAYLVTDAGCWMPSDWRDQLRISLPDYMIPAAFVRLDVIPKTAVGKIDRKALPKPTGEALLSTYYEAPIGPVETLLAELAAKVLKVDQVGRFDNFFDRGGHSLLAVQLISRMRDHGLLAEVRDVFTATHLADLARMTRQRTTTSAVPPNLIPDGCLAITPDMLPLLNLTADEIEAIEAAIPGGAGNIQDIYPLAPLQEGVLFHHLTSTSSDTYILSSIMQVASRQHLDSLLHAMQHVINRHDMLRTAVLWKGLREPVQVVCRQAVLDIAEIDADACLAAGGALAALQARADAVDLKLDLGQPPLMRVLVASDTEAGPCYLMLLEHHIIGDHVSLAILVEEIQAVLKGDLHDLPASIPFRNFIAQLRDADKQQAALTFFSDMLADVSEPTVPFGLTNSQMAADASIGAVRVIDDLLNHRIRYQAQVLGMSPAVLCHLAWAMVVARASGRDDVVLGTVLSGRAGGVDAIERIYGPFINTLPVRLQLAGVTVAHALAQTRQVLADLLVHEQTSLAAAQRCSGVLAPAPLFTAMLNYRHTARDTTADGLGLQQVALREWTNYPLDLSIDDWGDSFTLALNCDRRVSPDRVLDHMEAALQSLTQALISEPEATVLALDWLPASERQQLSRFAGDAAIVEVTELLPARFGRLAAQYPDLP
ncbi:condensation domain-containing protein, partial [Chitinivorax sp. B]|uniref:condensation domain-containing protein n=1 Tax=Chitinivorax sp. B TaxID=2502235 RepID=UPI0014851BF0